MSAELKAIFTASGMLEAEILRSLLESQDIPVMLSREAAMSAFSVGVGPLAQVDLLVPHDRQDEAKNLLDDYFAGRLDSEEDVPAG